MVVVQYVKACTRCKSSPMCTQLVTWVTWGPDKVCCAVLCCVVRNAISDGTRQTFGGSATLLVIMSPGLLGLEFHIDSTVMHSFFLSFSFFLFSMCSSCYFLFFSLSFFLSSCFLVVTFCLSLLFFLSFFSSCVLLVSFYCDWPAVYSFL